jgi:hypothetical protein
MPYRNKIPQTGDTIGSQKDIQVLINKKNIFLDKKISEKINCKKELFINWVSPKEEDEYAEYLDNGFLQKLGLLDISRKNPLVKSFWPLNGPHWDALGKTNDGKYFIVEAKANIPEMIQDISNNINPESKKIIENTFCEVINYLGIQDNNDWTMKFYQYATHVAHLYYLREKLGIDAYLIYIYFLNDPIIPKREYIIKTINAGIPQNLFCDNFTSHEKWDAVINIVEKYLGLDKKHKLDNYIIKIFITWEDLMR